jgi:hypothetical protein
MKVFGICAWLVLSAHVGVSQTKKPLELLLVPKGSKILVRMADSDCESHRFKSRLERELEKRGLVPIHEPDEFNYELRVSFQGRNTEGSVETVALKQLYKEKHNAPENTVNASWGSIPREDRTHLMSNSVVEEISSWKDRVHTVYIAESPDDLRNEVGSRLEASGYRLSATSENADLTVRLFPTITEEIKAQQRMDYTFQVAERNTKAVLYSKTGYKIDPGVYAEPLDLVAGSAIEIAKGILLK